MIPSPTSLPPLILVFFALATVTGVSPVSADATEELNATDIVTRFVAAQSVETEMVFIRMDVLQKGELVDERRLLALYEKGPAANIRSMVRVVRPKEVEGVTLLALVDAGGNAKQSIYLPMIGRTRTLAGEANAAPFLGSDFSYEDLLNEIPGRQNYTRREDAAALGAPCFVIRAHPISEDAVYGFRDLYIEKKSFRLYRIDYYDRDSTLIKTLKCYDYDSPQIFGNTSRPYRTVMSNAKTGSSTVFTVIVGRMGDDFDDAFFTPEFVESWSSDAVEDFMFQLNIVITGQSSDE